MEILVWFVIAVARVRYAIKPVARVQTKATQPSAGSRDYLYHLGRGVRQITGKAQYLNPATGTFRNVELFTRNVDANWLVELTGPSSSPLINIIIVSFPVPKVSTPRYIRQWWRGGSSTDASHKRPLPPIKHGDALVVCIGNKTVIALDGQACWATQLVRMVVA